MSAKPYYEGKGEDAKKEHQGEHDPMEGKGDKFSGTDLGALERDLLKYDFNEAEHGGANETLILMTPSSFLSPTKEPSASVSPVEPLSLMEAQQRRRRFDESLRVAFLSKLPAEEWERYQCGFKRKTGEVWTRVAFMESTWDIIWRYSTQPVMGVGLNQPIMRDLLGKMMEPTESDSLTESVTEESAEESRLCETSL